VDTDLSH